MLFKSYYLGCLSQASYLIGDGGEAVVVDPQRDVDQYLEDARAAGLAIRHVVETHLHADFVSGHLELARRTGARIYMGHRAAAEFAYVPVRDGDQLRLGSTVLRFLETPGHTPESISVLVLDESSPTAPAKILTGDTLFIGDVGRPDLVGSKGYSAEQMAEMLYDSLHGKLLALPDDTEVWPAHGAGSACGRFISEERFSTIGDQKRTNYALQPMPKADFVRLVTAGLPPPPRYFAHDAERNRRGAPALAEIPPPPPLSPDDVARRHEEGAVILDVHDADAFARGHVPGSIHIGLRGSFAPWAGALLEVGRPIVLVAESRSALDEATMRLARVGLESVVGYLDGGPEAWARDGRELARAERIGVDELRQRLSGGRLRLLDVRAASEHAAGHVPGATNVPLGELEAFADRLDRDEPIYVICGSGYRSSIAASLLRARGFAHVVDVVGGHGAWRAAGFSLAAAPLQASV